MEDGIHGYRYIPVAPRNVEGSAHSYKNSVIELSILVCTVVTLTAIVHIARHGARRDIFDRIISRGRTNLGISATELVPGMSHAQDPHIHHGRRLGRRR